MVPSFLFFTAFGKYFEVVTLFPQKLLGVDVFFWTCFVVAMLVSSTDTVSFDFDLDHLQVTPHCQLANAYAVENVCNMGSVLLLLGEKLYIP